MKNCLKSTLKGVVNNSSLVKLGELIIENVYNTQTGSINASFVAKTQTTCVIKLLAETATFTNAPAQGLREQTITSAGERTITVSGVSGILFSDKYNLTKLVDNSGSLTVNIEDLEYMTSLQNLTLLGIPNWGKSYGDIKYLNRLENLKKLHLQSTGITGDIENLPNANLCTELSLSNEIYAERHSNVFGSISAVGAKMPNLTFLSVRETQVEGALEDLLDAMVSAGRTSGQMTIYAQNSQVTYNNAPIISALTATFNGTGWVVS